AVVVATTTIEVKRLDMALDSFDDQYQGCGPAMTAALPALKRSEFQKKCLFAQVWKEAAAEWQRRAPPVSPLSPDQATAIMAFSIEIYDFFNNIVHNAGHSPQEYRDNFHFKTLHFLLTDALATLRDARKGHCLDVFRQYCGVRFEAKPGNSMRFGEFFIMSLSKITESNCTVETLFQVHTCHGAAIQFFLERPEHQWVLIPPFETFEVTKVTREGGVTQIQLNSTGTFSKYNCEWLRGDTTGDSLG
ncbi:NARE ribosyltransferase, partial [Pycnonotus jocosus]|nr:NARE ribosyltransferase [Pycnonotus jocosus]